MNKKSYFFSILTVSLLFIFALSAGEAKEASEQLDDFFPEKNFVFDKVVEGTQVEHDFKVLNRGSATLKIERVKTG